MSGQMSISNVRPLKLPVRWVFDVSKWSPNQVEWEKAIRCIQEEEKNRIERFVFKEDTKCSLIGRLLIRKLCSESLCIPYNTLRLGRNEKERPYLIGYGGRNSTCNLNGTTSNTLLSDFNISHQGNYCVLAAEGCSTVGIDVMRMVYSLGNQSLPEMFNTMRRKFTKSEWDFICGPVTEKEQTKRFYRNWSLKESFVKAEGSGLGFELHRLSFQCQTPSLSIDQITTDTLLFIDGQLASEWRFEECLLDNEHCVVVATLKPQESYPSPHFHWLNFEELTSGAQTLLESDPNAWTKYCEKPCKVKR